MLAALALVAAVGFAGAIIVLAPTELAWHELGGLVLLVLILGAVVAAVSARRQHPRLLARCLLALGLLIGMGATGALLGSNLLPASYDDLPLVFLAGLIASLAEMIRVARVRGTAANVARAAGGRG